jgi:hypothetical protein
VRFDIATEAERLAAKINQPHGTRLVMFVDGMLPTYGIDTATAKFMLAKKPHRVVGVYAPGVTAEELAEDLAVML